MTQDKATDIVPQKEIQDLPQHLEQSKTTALVLKYADWNWKRGEVIDPDTSETKYTAVVEGHLKPKMQFFSGTDTTPVGEAIYHTTTFRIDVNVRGQSMALKVPRFLSSKYVFDSPAMQNQTMTWTSKSSWKTIDYVCLDAQQLPVAKLQAQVWAKDHSNNKIEFLGPVADNPAAKDEIVFTALALNWYIMIMLRAQV